jgi:hypothetical protein
MMPFPPRKPRPSSPSSLLPGFEHIPLLRADVLPYGDAVSRSPAGLWCRHRDASGQETGSELIKPGPIGGHAFTRGGTRSLFRTPGHCRPRLVLVDGPLQAIALAALKAHAAHTATFAAPGGFWSRAADQALTALVTADPPREIILAFASLRDGGCPSRDHVQALLRDILPAGARDPLVLEPPTGGWVAALHEARTTTRRAA